MAKKANARRYAQAIFEIALEQKELERWQSDLQVATDALSNAEFLAVMESPKIRFEDKFKLIKEGLADIGPLALNLIHLLIVKNSISLVSEIAGEYQRLVNSHYGIQTAEVVTAVPIDDKDKDKLAENLGAILDSKIIVESSVDPGILGGVIARVGGKLLDGSTRSKLAALKRELVGSGRKA